MTPGMVLSFSVILIISSRLLISKDMHRVAISCFETLVFMAVIFMPLSVKALVTSARRPFLFFA